MLAVALVPLEMIRTGIALAALAVQSFDVFVDTTVEGLGRHGGGSMEITL